MASRIYSLAYSSQLKTNTRKGQCDAYLSPQCTPNMYSHYNCPQMHTMIQPTGIIVINSEVFSLSAGERLQRVGAVCPFMCLLPSVHCTLCYSLSSVYNTQGSPLWAPASVWIQSSLCLCSNPLHSLTLQHPARSSPPTSVFNQLVPFISGNTGKKEFD